MEGWIKLHRKILLSQFGKNLELMGLFSTLLLMANHKEGFTVDGTKLLPGQFMTSQKELAKRFKMDRNRMRRMLEKLSNAGQIEQQTSEKNTIITIVNWLLYQQDEQQVNINRTSNEHQVNTNKNANNNKNNNILSGAEKNLPEKDSQEKLNPGLFAVEPLELEEEISVDQQASNALTLLNTLCFKNFRPVAGNMKHINARIREGYTLEDFRKVIKFKQEKWGNDPKMRGYLRPETIFGTKFDSYLAEASDERLKEISDDELIRQYFPGFTA